MAFPVVRWDAIQITSYWAIRLRFNCPGSLNSKFFSTGLSTPQLPPDGQPEMRRWRRPHRRTSIHHLHWWKKHQHISRKESYPYRQSKLFCGPQTLRDIPLRKHVLLALIRSLILLRIEINLNSFSFWSSSVRNRSRLKRRYVICDLFYLHLWIFLIEMTKIWTI